ncbi:TetR family transcriptional regulator [Nocardia rhizosphaerihabitans]|uniref:Transcriptional regulator, TetR family protein n=1 Tax=Nocardia rhizosphaerihabitans TaxID=1691570 RepID=A0ABQ2L2Q0_9NOCA|nr:TetR family transcriptional regulator [Nocardia rhizosphaerihabitans]GGO00587.1 putative transcriptional regulator, TetR family protein [Nocardia rhizosphaerihabitans]
MANRNAHGALSFHGEIRTLLRERALDSARGLVCADGWSAVTMSDVAQEIGISRQALYREFGSRQALAEALVGREVDVFLSGVVEGLRGNPEDAVDGMVQAVRFALRFGINNALLQAILSECDGQGNGLLPVLITDPETVFMRAIRAIGGVVREQYMSEFASDEAVDLSVEVLVRLTLSHLHQPRGRVDQAVAQIRRVLASLLHLDILPSEAID